MTQANTDFGRVADDLRRAAGSFALLTSSATAFGSSLRAFREFERQLVLTNAIAGGTVQQFNRMKEAARGFSLVTTVSAVEAGVALQQLAQAGFTAEESLQAMNGVLLLSQATLTDVAVTSDILSSNIRAFKLEAADTTRVANVFTATITGSLATMEKLAFAFRQVAPVAELAGLSIEETSAALGVLFNVGLRGEQAGTALRNIIIRLVRPLGEANELLQGAGIATRQANGDLRNLADILRDIAASDLTNADLARIFETEALAGVKAFISALEDIDGAGDDAYSRLLTNITNTDRALEIAAQNLDTFEGSLSLLRNSLTDVGISIGEQLSGPLREIADTIRDYLDAFRALPEETRNTISTVAGLTAAGVGLLAILNALVLILRGPLLAGLAGLSAKGLAPLTAALTAGAVAIKTFIAGLATITVGAGGVTLAAGASTVAVRALTASFIAFLATPVGAGLALITAGVASLGAALVLATQDARNATAEMERLAQIEFQQQSIVAQDFVDGIIPPGAIAEVEGRIKQLNNQLALIGTVGGPADIVGTANRKLSEIAILQSQIDNSTEELKDAASDLRELDQESERLVQNYFDTLDKFDLGTPEANAATTALNEFVEGLNAAERAELAALARARAINEGQIGDLADVAGGLFQARDEAISQLLRDLAAGDAAVPERVAVAANLLAGNLDTSPEFIAALTEAVAARTADGADVFDVALEEALRSLGIPIEKIVPLLVSQKQADETALLAALAAFGDGTSDIRAEAERALLENTLDTTKDIEEATRVAQELAILDLEEGLADVASELQDSYDDLLSQFGLAQNQLALDAFRAAADAQEGLVGDPVFAEVFSGQAVLEAINDAVTADSTPSRDFSYH